MLTTVIAPAPPTSSHQASLRRARREEKAAQINPECSFQPALYRNSRSTDRGSFDDRGRNRSRNRAYSVDRGQSQSRHELLYNDGERKRLKNLEAKNDPNQVRLVQRALRFRRRCPTCRSYTSRDYPFVSSHPPPQTPPTL